MVFKKLNKMLKNKIFFSYFFILLFFPLLAVILNPTTSLAKLKKDTIIAELRKDIYYEQTGYNGQTLYMGGFGISENEVSDSQLRDFIKGNRKWLESVIQQNYFGQGLQLWVTQNKCLTKFDIKGIPPENCATCI